MPAFLLNRKTGQVIPMPGKNPMFAPGPPGSPHRFVPRVKKPKYHPGAYQDWHKDRKWLDLGRSLPPGAVSIETLRRINPGFFYAWNLNLLRWEIWCERDEWGMVPYWVLRVAQHPNIRHPVLGQIVYPCPARPARYRMRKRADGTYTGMQNCPPDCPGVYMVPDGRVVKVLGDGTVLSGQDGERRICDALDDHDLGRIRAIDKYQQEMTHDIWGEHFNELLDIESVGYTGREQDYSAGSGTS